MNITIILESRRVGGGKENKMIKAVLSTTIVPLDGTYDIRTVKNADIAGVPHYIGHPATKEIVERMGAIKADSNLFAGLEIGEKAVAFSIKQGLSSRKSEGFTNPHQDVTADQLQIRIIERRA